MHVVVLTVALAQGRPEVGADFREYVSQKIVVLASEYVPSVFRYEDQVNVHPENAVSTSAVILSVGHRPTW
ncbi:hypothetical protein GCM10027444_44220 [Actinopolyspora lacussalsi]